MKKQSGATGTTKSHFINLSPKTSLYKPLITSPTKLLGIFRVFASLRETNYLFQGQAKGPVRYL